MSNQGPTVETDPKKIEALIKTIETAVREFEQALKQYTERSNSRIKERMLERMNRFVTSAIRYAMEGDHSTHTGSYPQWIVDNQEQLDRWLENPQIDNDVKEEIRTANRKARGEPDPKSQPQPQTASDENDLKALLKSARNIREFISIIENYRGEIFSINGLPLNKTIMLNKLREFSSDPEILKLLASAHPPIDIFARTNITSNYEMRDTFIRLAKIEYQNKVLFPKALKSANSLQEFINVIKSHPNVLESNDGRELDVNIMLAKIHEISSKNDFVELIAQGRAPSIIFDGSNITRQYGMRDKFIELVKKQYNADLNNKFAHLKPEVVRQIVDMFRHFGTHYYLDTKNGVNFSFQLHELGTNQRKAFESVLQKANISFDVDDYNLNVSVPPTQFAKVIAALKEAAMDMNNSQQRLQQRIDKATTISEIVKVIKEHDGIMLSRGGLYLDKQAQVKAILNFENPNFAGDKVTSNYGLENKIKSVIQLRITKSEVIKQVADIFKHFGTHYTLNVEDGVKFTFPHLNLSNENLNAFVLLLQKANIPFDVNDYGLNVSIPTAQFGQVNAALKEVANEINRSQVMLHEKIVQAKSSAEIIKVIKEHDGIMLSKGGNYLNKDAQIKAIQNMQNPDPAYDGAKVTSNYGLESKVNILVQQQRAAERPLPPTPPQRQTPDQQSQPQPNPQAQRPVPPPRAPLKPQASQQPQPQPQPNIQAQKPSQLPPRPDIKSEVPQQPPLNFSPEVIRNHVDKALKTVELQTLFNVDKEKLMKEYQAIRAGHGFSGWVNARVKDVGKAIGNQGKLREHQISDLATAFNMINKDVSMDSREKALNMYAYLSKLSIDVSLESSTFKQMSPAIIKLCEQYMKRIEEIVGKVDIENLSNSADFKARAHQVEQRLATTTPTAPNVNRNNRNK